MNRRMNKRGVALIISFLVISILSILGVATISRSTSESSVAQRFVRSTQAFWLAEAGVQEAARNLIDGNWPSPWTPEGGDGYSRPDSSLGAGSYSVSVSCTTCSNPSVTSTGTVGGIQRQITARFGTSSPFNGSAFSKGSLSMSGNGKTDSYDSSKGAYNVGGNKGSNGDVGSNGTTAGTIKLSGNAIVNGDASTGPSGTVTTSGNAKVNGTITDDNNRNLSSVVVPSCLTTLADAGNYSVSANNKKTITNGNYRYSSFSISGNGQVTVTGTVKIYLTGSSSLDITGNGKLTISGGGNLIIYTDGVCNIAGNGIANNTSVPSNFILKSTYSGSNGVNITGNGELKGVIYAPDTDLKNSGNGSIFGAVIGKTVNISGNGDIHYDEALSNLGGFSNPAIQNWADDNNPYPL